MFNFFKKTFHSSHLLQGFTDVHCHILPGVDDGVRHTSEALDVLRYYEESGVRRVFFTPHIAEELHQNTRDHLIGRFSEFVQAYQGKLELCLGAEYMLDEGFSRLLDSNEQFLCAADNTILVETVTSQPPYDFDQILFELQDRGYDVMLAHPERYHYMEHNDYEQLKSKGIKLQMNICSLAGMYGQHAIENAKWLLENGFYSFMGTDLHNLKRHTHCFDQKAYTSAQLGKMEQLRLSNDSLPSGKISNRNNG